MADTPGSIDPTLLVADDDVPQALPEDPTTEAGAGEPANVAATEAQDDTYDPAYVAELVNGSQWMFGDVDVRAHATEIDQIFTNLLYYGGHGVHHPPEEADDEESDDDDEAVSSRGSSPVAADAVNEDDDDILDFDKISDDEDDRSEGEGSEDNAAIDKEFAAWLDGRGVPQPSSVVPYIAGDDAATDVVHARLTEEMRRLQLSRADEDVATGPMPERFMLAAQNNQRPLLGAIPLPNGDTYTLQDEPLWIFLQMRRPGRMLSRSAVAAALCLRPVAEIRQSPVVASIAEALRLMTTAFLEPAHIAIHHRAALQPLLDTYLDGQQHRMEDGSVRIDAAYSAVTGQRQIPFPDGGYNAFASRPAAADDNDPLWLEERKATAAQQRAIRKPSSIHLGRLLWEIFDLDMMCHRLERGRLAIGLEQQHCPFFTDVHDTILAETTFQDPSEVLFWTQFANHCARKMTLMLDGARSLEERRAQAARMWNTNPTQVIHDLTLETYFSDLFLPASKYHLNLARALAGGAGTALAEGQQLTDQYITREAGEELHTWLSRIGSEVKVDAYKMMKLFAGAFIEQYAKLPTLRKVALDAFLEAGEMLVVPTGPVLLDGSSGVQVFRIAQLMDQNPLRFLHFYNLSQATIPGSAAPVRLEFRVAIDAVLAALQCTPLFMSADCTENDSFNIQRRESFHELAQYVAENAIPSVRSALLQTASLVAARLSSTELGRLCAEGPYQRTRLHMSNANPAASIWDGNTNVVEAIADPKMNVGLTAGAARVCAVTLSSDRVPIATFVFCDGYGNLAGTCRWTLGAIFTNEGKAAHRRQCQNLREAVGRYRPHVIAVAACDSRSAQLFRRLEEFVRDYVQPHLSVHIPVVWTQPCTGAVYAFTAAAERELPDADPAIRNGTSVARFTRDPLLELCRLFNPETRDALQLPLYVPLGCDEGLVYTHLEREMSLWVTAVGFDISTVLAQSHAPRVLQFAAGLGPRKAAQLLAMLSSLPGGLASRSPIRSFFEDSCQAPAVARNCLPAIRVPLVDGGAGEEAAHPCDATLIPPALYDLADRLALIVACMADARILYAAGMGAAEEQVPLAVAWLTVLEMSEEGRWTFLTAVRTNDIIMSRLKLWIHARAGLLGPASPFAAVGEQTLDFIVDELVAMGRSYQRRPFRLISGRVLFKQLTSISYFSTADVVSGAALACDLQLDPPDLTIKEGDTLECAVDGINQGQFIGIRVTTTHGLSGNIRCNPSGIPDEQARRELDTCAIRIGEARSRGEPIPTPPEWLQRGAPIYAVVQSVDFQRCEVRLQWIPSPPLEDLDAARATAAAAEEEFDALEAGEEDFLFGAAHASNASSTSGASSIRSVAIHEHAAVYRTKASRHPLFRNVLSGASLERLLGAPTVEIGEVLLRPLKGRTSWLLLCVKVAADRICSWPLHELRGRTGAAYYELPDRRRQRTQRFDSIDHCVRVFAERMAGRIAALRQHRRFYPSVEAAGSGVSQAVLAQRDQGIDDGRHFAYAFAETAAPLTAARFAGAPMSSGASNLPYCVVYFVGGRRRQSPIYVDNEGFHVKLRTLPSPSAPAGYGWFSADTPEALSTVVKHYANHIHKIQSRAAASTATATGSSAAGSSARRQAVGMA